MGTPFSMEFHLLSLYLEGVCLGMQLAVVEFSRNVLGWQGKCLLVLNSHWNVPGACWTVGAMEARLGFPVSHSHREGKLLNVSTENTALLQGNH